MSAPGNAALFGQSFATILVVMDPFGNVPVFLSLTRDRTPSERNLAAGQAAGVAAGVVLCFALFGQEILHLLGVSLASLEVAGGIILLLAAFELLHPGLLQRGPRAPAVNVAFVPLGTPLLAGPGAIVATMVYVRRAGGPVGVLIVLSAALAVLVLVYLTLRYAGLVGRMLKDSGIELLSRIVALLLAAIATQMAAMGVLFWAHHGLS